MLYVYESRPKAINLIVNIPKFLAAIGRYCFLGDWNHEDNL
jgi:hypothetical protein